MRKLLTGITFVVCSVMVICTGFILSALYSVHNSHPISVNFTYSIFKINFLWFLIPVVLFGIGIYLMSWKDED